jgi:hypothetical protein
VREAEKQKKGTHTHTHTERERERECERERERDYTRSCSLGPQIDFALIPITYTSIIPAAEKGMYQAMPIPSMPGHSNQYPGRLLRTQWTCLEPPGPPREGRIAAVRLLPLQALC